jgi:hypothetical protein
MRSRRFASRPSPHSRSSLRSRPFPLVPSARYRIARHAPARRAARSRRGGRMCLPDSTGRPKGSNRGSTASHRA